MSDHDEVVRALLAARVPESFATLHAYAPDPAPVAVRLDANEAPALLPTLRSEERLVLQQALSAVEPARYPDVRAGRLRGAIAQQLAVGEDQLCIGCGSDEVIAILLSTLGRPVHGAAPRVLVPSPTFVMYRVSARVHGYEVVEVPLDPACDLDEPAMLAALQRTRPAVLFLASPNNPTSSAFDRAKVERLVRAAAQLDPPTLVVVDEAYLPFRLGDGDPWHGATGLDLLAAHGNVAVLRTLSKIGLAALRVGWLVGAPALVAQMEKARLPYDLPTYSQAVAEASFGALAPAIARHVGAIVDERRRVVGRLNALGGVSFPRPDANFVWLGVSRPAADVAAAMKRSGVLVRSFPAVADRLRITVGTPAEDDRMLEALVAALRG